MSGKAPDRHPCSIEILLGAVYVQDANVQVLEGVGIGYPFTGVFTPRVWNGTVYYEQC